MQMPAAVAASYVSVGTLAIHSRPMAPTAMFHSLGKVFHPLGFLLLSLLDRCRSANLLALCAYQTPIALILVSF